jgi:hypothetical protein
MKEEEKEIHQVIYTAKEIKNMAKPEFAANPEKFYPTDVFKKFGYTRH